MGDRKTWRERFKCNVYKLRIVKRAAQVGTYEKQKKKNAAQIAANTTIKIWNFVFTFSTQCYLPDVKLWRHPELIIQWETWRIEYYFIKLNLFSYLVF